MFSFLCEKYFNFAIHVCSVVCVLLGEHKYFCGPTMEVIYFGTWTMLAVISWEIRICSSFSKQQYFDSKGMFISIVFSIPMLFNCMIMVANWLWQSSELLTQLKVAQMRQRVRQQNAAAANSDKSLMQRKKTDWSCLAFAALLVNLIF